MNYRQYNYLMLAGVLSLTALLFLLQDPETLTILDHALFGGLVFGSAYVGEHS